MPTSYTDLLNKALDNLATALTAISPAIPVVTDPRNIQGACAFINAPTFSTPLMKNKRIQLTFPIQLIVPGPFNLDAQRKLLNMTAQLLAANVAITEGRPTSIEIGGALYPCYEVIVNMEASSL
jgi:hypothetical protein